MTEVTVAIPWRPGQIDREIHHDYVAAALREMLPQARHIDVDAPGRRFHRAAARNAAVREAGGGVVVLCDADTVPEAEPLHAAVQAAADNGRLNLPYTLFKGLSREGALQVHLRGATPRTARALETSPRPTGGVWVIHHDAWWDAGGMDERFTGWGWEDTAFRDQADCLLGPTVRHHGVIYHLWHPSEADLRSPEYRRNQSHYQRFRAARRSPARMRALLGLAEAAA